MEEEAECSLLCKARLDHLMSYAAGEQTEGMKTAWRQNRVDRMLVDHFLRAGYYTAAYKLSKSSGIEVNIQHTRMYTNTHTHTYIHVHTHTHTHTHL